MLQHGVQASAFECGYIFSPQSLHKTLAKLVVFIEHVLKSLSKKLEKQVGIKSDSVIFQLHTNALHLMT